MVLQDESKYYPKEKVYDRSYGARVLDDKVRRRVELLGAVFPLLTNEGGGLFSVAFRPRPSDRFEDSVMMMLSECQYRQR